MRERPWQALLIGCAIDAFGTLLVASLAGGFGPGESRGVRRPRPEWSAASPCQ